MKYASLALKYWREILITTLIGIVVYQNFFETRFLLWAETIPSLELRLDAVELAMGVCVKGNETLSNTIDTRNDEVEQWVAVTTALENDIGSLETRLSDNRIETKIIIKRILVKEPTPTSCPEAINYLRDARNELKW